MHSKILIIDFGSQFTQLVARRVRELGVYSEVVAHDCSDERLLKYYADAGDSLRGIILSGGPNSVYNDNAPRISDTLLERGCPVLGICYGMQAMAHQLGGCVEGGAVREFGHADVTVTSSCDLFDGIADVMDGDGDAQLKVWMSHGDKVVKLPAGFKSVASSAACEIAAMYNASRMFYGVQFHPEVTHTVSGRSILSRFVHDICHCTSDWDMPHYVNEAIDRIRTTVGGDGVLLGLSGGVDSSVAAVLIHRAIGKQLTCVFVDHGLMKTDSTNVISMFAQHLGVNVIVANEQERFMNALVGVVDPEEKRKIIGREFVHVFQQKASQLHDVQWLAQGTIYPDVIESAGTGHGGHVIKSHHNVGGLPSTLHLKLLEPLRSLFKDEVRLLGLALGIPRHMVYLHPFPGPGLGVRILGEVKREYADMLRHADDIFLEVLRHTPVSSDSTESWYDATSQAFAVFLPVKSVGVMGDGRTYEYVVALRCVQTSDFMTAHWAHLPYDLLGTVSNRIINEVRGVNRVVYDISGKPPSTIEWE